VHFPGTQQAVIISLLTQKSDAKGMQHGTDAYIFTTILLLWYPAT
jgi:hypothetical protein